jgi:hypothetical protein
VLILAAFEFLQRLKSENDLRHQGRLVASLAICCLLVFVGARAGHAPLFGQILVAQVKIASVHTSLALAEAEQVLGVGVSSGARV